ncbi:uncharacterized protein BDCG_00619 [Blastomyces dermatitidis ER-3]|uniref:Uncharacterized protein n=1 Tax=Ajellomyces dermatitidis (strain ER-3 / ATCC MYA-2586) TaxID=559297 RepID=A0ABP2ENQ7_AJEDR|nr:uncharacterized protein BDCG_00619 [Blastomyces dermatitidis ER-3]EEQ83814.2 hypothetical protein BDCG_00619 [Blastomyces dermatitidis ER-3]
METEPNNNNNNGIRNIPSSNYGAQTYHIIIIVSFCLQRRQRTPLLSVLFLGTPGGDFTRSHFAMPANRIGARPFRPVSAAELGWFMQPGLFEVATTIKTMMNPYRS